MTLAVPSGYVIRDVTDPLALRELEDIQAAAWGYSDRELLPLTMFRISGAMGGVVLAAYPEGGGPAAGLVYGFPALRGGQLWHHSHQLALRPEVRGTGLAVALKLAQRERVLAQGLTRMTWTFDPLVTRNARLNFGKLGITVSEYLPDWYGPGADRLLADWDLTRPHAERPASRPVGEYVLQAVGEHPGLPYLNADAPRLLAEAPLKPDPVWRRPLREVLTHYLGRGYHLTDLARAGERAFYVLEWSG